MKKNCFFIILLFTISYVHGQIGNSDFANSLGRVSKSIFLFEYSLGGQSIPVTLTYNSNGMRYDDRNSGVGVGWSINNLEFAYEQTIRGKNDWYSRMPNMDSVQNVITQFGTNPLNSQREHIDGLLALFAKDELGNANEFPIPTFVPPNYVMDRAYDIFSFDTFSGGGRFICKNRDYLYYRGGQHYDPFFFDEESKRFQIKKFIGATDEFEVIDDKGNTYIFSSGLLHQENVYIKKMLSNVVSDKGDIMSVDYQYFNINNTRRDSMISVMEGFAWNYSPPYTTGSSSTMGRIPIDKDQYSVLMKTQYITTPFLKIEINYMVHDGYPLIDYIEVYNRTDSPVQLYRVQFSYILNPKYAFLKNVAVSKRGYHQNTYTFGYSEESNLATANFDRDLNGFAFINNSKQSFSSSFPSELSTFPIYSDGHSIGSFSYRTLQSQLPAHALINIPFASKERVPSSWSDVTPGLLTSVYDGLNTVRETFKYGNNQFFAGNNLYEYLKVGEDYGPNGLVKDTLDRRMYVYTDVGINDPQFQNYYDYNIYADQANSGGWISNKLLFPTGSQDGHLRERLIISNLWYNGSNTWRLVRNYIISSNNNMNTYAGYNTIASSAIYYDNIKEIVFAKNKPVSIIERKYDATNLKNLNNHMVISRNLQYTVADQGLVSRNTQPEYLSFIYALDRPSIKQENTYELHSGQWRISRKTTYNYQSGTDGSHTLKELYLQDFARISQHNLANSRSIQDIYALTGLNSFFDYSFYDVYLNTNQLLSSTTVDYKYND